MIIYKTFYLLVNSPNLNKIFFVFLWKLGIIQPSMKNFIICPLVKFCFYTCDNYFLVLVFTGQNGEEVKPQSIVELSCRSGLSLIRFNRHKFHIWLLRKKIYVRKAILIRHKVCLF